MKTKQEKLISKFEDLSLKYERRFKRIMAEFRGVFLIINLLLLRMAFLLMIL